MQSNHWQPSRAVSLSTMWGWLALQAEC